MPFGEFSIIFFEFLSDFWRKSQNDQGGKTRQKSGLRCGEAEGPERPPLGFAKE